MPKPFKLLLEVEEAALGAVMNLLARTPGVLRVDPLIENRAKQAKAQANGHGGERKTRFVDPSGKTSADLVIAALAKAKKPLRSPDFTKLMTDSGRAPTSASGPLHILQKDGLIEHTGEGYRLTKRGRDKARYV